MAKFCTNCGKPLPESGVCECQTVPAAAPEAAPQYVQPQEAPQYAQPQAAPQPQYAPPQQAPQPQYAQPQQAPQPQYAQPQAAPQPQYAQPQAAPQQPQYAQQAPQQPYGAPTATATPIAQNVYVKQTKQAVGQFMPFVKTYFGNPAGATLTALREKNMALALVMMALSALVSGLMVWTSASKLFGGVMEMMGGDASVPFFSTFFGGFAVSLLVLALSTLAMFLLLKLVRVNASFQYVLIAVGVNSVLSTAFMALAWVLMLVGLINVSVIVLLLGTLLWIVLGISVTLKVFNAKYTCGMILLFTALIGLTLYLNLWLGSKLLISAVGADDMLSSLGGMLGSAMYGF